jgi:hypothetical protein
MLADQATRRITTIGTRKVELDTPKSAADGKRKNSIYDSYTWQAKYADPGFHKHVRYNKPCTWVGVLTLLFPFTQTAAAQMLGLMSK